jgi:hypothetical protein
MKSSPASRSIRRECSNVKGVRNNSAFVGWHGVGLDGTARDGFTDGSGAEREDVGQTIREHTHTTAFVDIVHRGNHLRWSKNLEYSRYKIGLVGMAMYQIGPEGSEDASGAEQATDNAHRRLVHVEMQDV